MSWKVEEPTEYQPCIIPNDVYAAEVKKIDERVLEHGATAFVTFEIIEGEQAGTSLTYLASCEKVTPNTKLGRMVEALGIEVKVNNSIDPDSLIGKQCRILTRKKKIVRKDGTTYEDSKVSEVLPVKEVAA